MLEVNNGIPLIKHGEKIEFENHEYVTSEPGIIRFLRSHKSFGFDFVEDKPDEIPGGKEAAG
jgi:hypothetical protein